MVFFQMKYDLNVWAVLITGVLGSTLGRYLLSLYIPMLSSRFLKAQKNENLQYIGQKLADNGWKIQLFVLLYTLMPLPSTPLFTAAGIARVRAMHIIPAFFIGKFTSDTAMVLTGSFVANNTESIVKGMLNWQSILVTLLGIFIICVFIFIDWRVLLQQKKFRLNFRVFK